jgi:putative peptide zinc metalloprotease protein
MSRLRSVGLVAVLTTVFAFGAPAARADDGVRGASNNIVNVVNRSDGASRVRARSAVPQVDGSTVDNTNIASAYASCTDCRTVAVAVQVVVVEGQVTDFEPGNAAVALNENCLRCQTFAYARQEVLSPGTPVELSDDAVAAIRDLQDQIQSVAQSDEDFAQMSADLDGLTEQVVSVVQGEIDRAGTTATLHHDRRVDERDD